MRIPFILTPNSVSAHINGKTLIAKKDHPSFADIVIALKADEHDADAVGKLFDIKATISLRSDGKVVVKGDTVLYNGEPVHSTLATRMLAMLTEGFNIDPMVKFMENLYANQSFRSVQCLYDFLEVNNIPLTPDGDFLAYKKVKNDYTDYHTGKMRNAPGDTVRMERNKVDEDPDRTCSSGLHVCAEHYLSHYYGSQGRVVICKINPKHVVAVPRDYNNSKMRVSEYVVVGEVPEKDAAKYFHSAVIDPSKGFSEGVDDSADYYDAAAVLVFNGDFEDEDTSEDDIHVRTIGDQEITFVWEDGTEEWVAYYAAANDPLAEYWTGADIVEDAEDEFFENCVIVHDVWEVTVVGLNEDANLVEDIYEVCTLAEIEDEDDAAAQALEEFEDEYGFEGRVRSVEALPIERFTFV